MGESLLRSLQEGKEQLRTDTSEQREKIVFSAADVGAIAHLYRGELYRSTVWRTRLDSTTNWAVVTTGISLTISFSSAQASPFPLLLAGLLVAVFLSTEARRYRFYDFWRVRAHVLELYFYGPMLAGQNARSENGWSKILQNDYRKPRLHISYFSALGRRIRRNYAWIFAIQAASYFGKLLIHPVSASSFGEILDRAALGAIPGSVVVGAGIIFHSLWISVALATIRSGRGVHRDLKPGEKRDPILELAQGHVSGRRQ